MLVATVGPTAFWPPDATSVRRLQNCTPTIASAIYLFGVLCRFQHCTGHITTGSWKGRGNQYIEFVRVLYCKLPNNGKQLPAFPHKALTGIEPRPQRWEARVLHSATVAPIYIASANQIAASSSV